MAVAIRSDVLDAFTTAAQRARNLRQQRTVVACDEPNCGTNYVIYYGPVMKEAEIVDRVRDIIGWSHPEHVHAYGFTEAVPEPDASN